MKKKAQRRKRIGILGCGTIGTETAVAIVTVFQDYAELVAVCYTNTEAVDKLNAQLHRPVPSVSLDALCRKSDLVIEAASAAAVGQLIALAIDAGCDLLIMSVGGVLDREEDLIRLAKAGRHIYIPSGAVGGIDVLKAAMMSDVQDVQITTRKPVEGLRGAPYIEEKNICLEDIREETVIFEGKAREAIQAFPKNVNVAAAISLAGIGPDRTRVRIVVCPDRQVNAHEITIRGRFGSFHCLAENDPSPTNPKTSYLAALSCMATLKKVLEGMEIGT